MSEEQPTSALEQQINRLLVVFNPPELSDEDTKVFMVELKNALRDFPTDALVDGVTEIIKSRRARSLPSIGEIRQHVMDRLPHGNASAVDMSAVFRSEDIKRDKAMKTLRELPLAKRQRIVRDQAHLRVFDFVVANDRLPDAGEYRDILHEGERIQRLLDEAGQAPGEQSSAFRHITWKVAEAIRFRREQIAERLLGQQQEVAE